ncbi:hypothetical protein HY639_02320 [Candidatus Woesearchaeota archaeon]|nr:hypothetical protein [Candidatus Woesearchaeota archaeon]
MKTEPTTTIKVLGKALEVPLPQFYTHVREGIFQQWVTLDNSMGWGYKQHDQRRHLSMAELADILSCKTDDTEAITAGLFFASRQFDRNIMTCDGLRREGQNLIMFRNIDSVVNTVYGSYDETLGYKISAASTGQRFTLERLFRKYVPETKGVVTVPLKHVDKANPDLVDYLFQQAYEHLPAMVQNATISVPYDFLVEQNRNWEGHDCNVWPLSLSFTAQPTEGHYNLNEFALQGVHIGVDQWSNFNLFVKENK